jgi:SAM-dependent methyltransferase
MPVLQDNVFLQSEGDRWFARNQNALAVFDAESDLAIKLMALYGLRPDSALEIGAANGFRLAEIHRRSGARVVAVEPSTRAIAEGQNHFPFVTFVRGLAHSIPLHEYFDVVIVNFVLHWVDRTKLVQSIAEIDRMVKDGGFLIIGDFYPTNRLQVRYHHLPTEDLQTFKQDYAQPFLASGLYHPVALLTGDHAAKTLNANVAEGDRIGAWLLRKHAREHYIANGADRYRG